MEQTLSAYNHICVDKSDKENHKMMRVTLLVKGKSLADLPEIQECPLCHLEFKKALVQNAVGLPAETV